MSAPEYLCDLHCHTSRSDGCDTPLELVQKAAETGMKIVAVTDHDTVPPQTVLPDHTETGIVEYAASLGLRLVLGTEISCDTYVDDVHVLGYGCNWDAPFFGEMEAFVNASKLDGYKKFIQRLNELDIRISWEEVEKACGGNFQKKKIFELMAQKGFFPGWKEAKIWANENPDLDIRREKPDPEEVIRRIHESGGIAVLAHPYLIPELFSKNARQVTREAYIRALIESGLDGMEASYTYDKTSYNGRLSKEEIFNEVTEKYGRAVGALTGGSDYHADEKKGVANPRRIGECGIRPEYFYSNPLLKNL